MARELRGKPPEEAVPSKPKILIAGRPGVGKTWVSLEFPGVYYIDTEGGANLKHYTAKMKDRGGAYLGPQDGSNDFNVVTEEIISLATTKHNYKTLVIDSYSKLFNTQIATDFERMEKAGRDMEKTFAAEKKPAINWTRKWLRWFEKLDMNVILICHEKDIWRDNKVVGQGYDGWDKLEYELHLALQIVKTGHTRKARVTKSRLEQFTELESFPWSYEEFARRFGQDVIEGEVKVVVAATAAQVVEMKELLAIVRLPEDTIEKWFAKAGVDTWEEMTTEQIAKAIEFVRKRLPGAAAA